MNIILRSKPGTLLIKFLISIRIGSIFGKNPHKEPITSPSIVPTFLSLVIVMTIFGWLGLASTLRNNIIIIRNRDFNIASKTLGSSPRAIITHNLLPFLVSIIVTILATSIPGVIDGEVSLAFFNLSLRFLIDKIVSFSFFIFHLLTYVSSGLLHPLN